MDGQMKARLDGLDLSAQGSANLSGIDLKLNVKMVPPADEQGHNIEFSKNRQQKIVFKPRTATDLNFSTHDLSKKSLWVEPLASQTIGFVPEETCHRPTSLAM
jgi:hypothetical protein